MNHIIEDFLRGNSECRVMREEWWIDMSILPEIKIAKLLSSLTKLCAHYITSMRKR